MVTLIVKARSRSLLDIAYRSLWSVLLPVKRKDCLDDARLQFFRRRSCMDTCGDPSRPTVAIAIARPIGTIAPAAATQSVRPFYEPDFIPRRFSN